MVVSRGITPPKGVLAGPAFLLLSPAVLETEAFSLFLGRGPVPRFPGEKSEPANGYL